MVQKFLVPMAMIGTYIVFNITAAIMAMVAYKQNNRDLFYVANLVMIIGALSDATIYILMQRDVKLLLLRKLKMSNRRIRSSITTFRTSIGTDDGSAVVENCKRDVFVLESVNDSQI